MPNPRDKRGWRIPREGTERELIYHLLLAGFTAREIINLFQEDINHTSVRVQVHTIMHPEKNNKRANNYYKNNFEKHKAAVAKYNSGGKYSKYVIKLVKVLEISYTEAVAMERKVLEKSD